MIKVKELTLTSPSFPSQWEGITTEGKVIYIRYRFGQLMFAVAKNIDRCIARADDSFGMAKNVGSQFEGELSQDAMLKHMDDIVSFKGCKFKKPKVVFYEFYSSQRPDEVEISTDRARIKEWESYKPFDEAKFHEFMKMPDGVLKVTQGAIAEIGKFGWDAVMNKTKG